MVRLENENEKLESESEKRSVLLNDITEFDTMSSYGNEIGREGRK